MPGFLRYRFTDRTAVKSITIPIFEMSKDDSNALWSLLAENQITNITLVPSGMLRNPQQIKVIKIDDPNPWDPVLQSAGYYVFTGTFWSLFYVSLTLRFVNSVLTRILGNEYFLGDMENQVVYRILWRCKNIIRIVRAAVGDYCQFE